MMLKMLRNSRAADDKLQNRCKTANSLTLWWSCAQSHSLQSKPTGALCNGAWCTMLHPWSLCSLAELEGKFSFTALINSENKLCSYDGFASPTREQLPSWTTPDDNSLSQCIVILWPSRPGKSPNCMKCLLGTKPQGSALWSYSGRWKIPANCSIFNYGILAPVDIIVKQIRCSYQEMFIPTSYWLGGWMLCFDLVWQGILDEW